VQLTDGRGRDFAAPQGFCNVFHTPDGYTCQVHLNEGLFHAAFPATVPLNDGGLEGDALEFRNLQGDIPGSGGKVSAIVAAAIALALLIALIPSSLGQFLCFSL